MWIVNKNILFSFSLVSYVSLKSPVQPEIVQLFVLMTVLIAANKLKYFIRACSVAQRCVTHFKWNSLQKATKALLVIENESNLCVKA